MKTKFIIITMLCLCWPLFSHTYYNGDGRSDLKIQVEAPELTNIGEETEWLPEFVINTVSDDIAKYSAITIVDTHNAKRIADTQRRDESISYSEEETVEAGKFAVAKNVLLVSIIGKNTSYSLSVRINDKEKNISIAAYSNPNCTFLDLESGKALKEAVADLLAQLNVNLTDDGKKSLLSVETEADKTSIAAQKLVAQGNIAQQKGSNIEALNYYIQAASSDESLERALKAATQSSQSIAAGDFGTQARNLIQRRNDFKKLIETAKEAFQKNLPYYIVYDPNIEMGKINYVNETFDIYVKVACVKDVQRENIYKNILTAYKNAPDSENWGLRDSLYSIFPSGDFNVTLQLSDKAGNVLGTTEKRIYISNNMSDFYSEGKYTISISAESDTSQIILSIPKIINQTNKSEVTLGTIGVQNYLLKIFRRYIKSEEVIQGVSVFMLPNYDASGEYNSFVKFFNYESLIKAVNINVPLYERKNIVCHSEAEGRVLRDIANYGKTPAGAWAFGKDCFYLNDNKPDFPRDKEQYLEKILDYLPIEWVKLPGTSYKFAAYTDTLKYVVESLGYSFTNMRFTYYKSTNLWSYLTTTKEAESISAYGRGVDDKLSKIINSRYYSSKGLLKQDNFKTTGPDGTKIGTNDEILQAFVEFASKHPTESNKLVTIYKWY